MGLTRRPGYVCGRRSAPNAKQQHMHLLAPRPTGAAPLRLGISGILCLLDGPPISSPTAAKVVLYSASCGDPKSVLKACHGPELLQTSSVEHPTCFHKVLQDVTNAAKANIKLNSTSESPVNFSPDLINALQASPEVRPLRLLAGADGARESRVWS